MRHLLTLSGSTVDPRKLSLHRMLAGSRMSNLRKFIGIYHGSQKHEPDLDKVLDRSWNNDLSKIIITACNMEESRKALEIARRDERLFSTVGCHPTHCNAFEESGDPDAYLKSLSDLAADNKDKIVAIGEMGLDYDRLQFCPKDVQKKYFELQLSLCSTLKLPMFLHCRNASEDFVRILRKHKNTLTAGVVHSFDGNPEEANSILQLGLYIGINGCSLKTEENLFSVTTIPSDRLMIETDCPWCEIRPTHASAKDVITNFPSVKKEKWQPDKMVKGRNEPCTIVQILEVLARIRDEEEEYLCNQIYKNTMKVFFPHEL
ncbi:putative deoxyribonuclease TATDN1 isoform X2 [Ceratina calcarata]|uniref:Deoxyribonuclease TATDN1 n=1 Tax=Ceratina calcarata TaxID=156304 RepID=A0AAJ7NA17_9HYME|nr:putative deoxyribonuclease TATDN1 isoform X2 [Ceratina calcarata]